MASEGTTLFVSRAGADASFSTVIGKILEEAGHRVILQQWDFANANFMERMHAALSGGARVIALLSPEYLASDHCQAEWQNAIADDPLNKKHRLILLRVAECEPRGLLAGLAYWDLVPIRDNRALLEELVRNAVSDDHRTSDVAPGPYWRAPRVVFDSEAVRPTPSFTGREAQLAEIASAFEHENLVAVHALGGVGKSSLAREYAWRERERYAVILWLHAETEDGIIEGFVRLGSLFVRGIDQLANRREAAEQVISSVLGGFSKPILTVFDNLEDERLLRTWHPRRGAQALITSRAAHWGSDVASIALDTWSADDAKAYLKTESARSDISEADADELTRALGGLPLALAHAAAYLRSTHTVGAQAYIARLNRQMAQAPRNADYPQAVFATFRAAIAKAESEAPGAAAVLCLASLYAPDAIPEELFGQPTEAYAESLRPVLPEMTGEALELRSTVADPASVDEAIGSLDHVSLVTFNAETRSFSIHRLVQAAAQDLLGTALSQWVETAVAAADAAFPAAELDTSTSFYVWPKCERLLPHARAALGMLPENTAYMTAGRLANSCGDYLYYRGAYADAELLFRQALRIREASLGREHRDVARTLNNLANVMDSTERFSESESLHRRALEIVEATLGPDHHDTIQMVNDFACLLAQIGRLVEAEPFFRRSLTSLEETLGHDHNDVAHVLNNLAVVLRRTNRATEAETLLRRALEIREAKLSPEDPDLAYPVMNLASILRDAGRHTEAEPIYCRALAIREASLGPEHPDVAQVLNELAILLRDTKRPAEAEPLFRRALTIRETSLGHEHGETVKTRDALLVLLRSVDRHAEAEALES